MTNDIDKILSNISAAVKQNLEKQPDFFQEERTDDTLLFLSDDMVISDKNNDKDSLEKQAKIIAYDVLENYDLNIPLKDLYLTILDSLRKQR